jgi:hypothetical protein
MVAGPIVSEEDVSPVILARGKIARFAKQHIGSRKWGKNSFYDYSSEGGGTITLNPFELDSRQWLAGTSCNLFVADICKMAGAKTWNEAKNSLSINRLGSTRELTVKEWRDVTSKLRGWIIVDKNSSPQLGDVAISMGHMGIVSGDGMLISDSSREGRVNEVKWDEMASAMIRRFIGLTQEEINTIKEESKAQISKANEAKDAMRNMSPK